MPVQFVFNQSCILLLTQCAGIFLLFGVMFLLFCRRVYLDSETKTPIKFTLPLMGEVTSQAPVLVLVLIGAAMVLFPVTSGKEDMVQVEGTIQTAGKPVRLLLVAVPNYEHSQDFSGKFSVQVPLLRSTGTTYRVKYLVDNQIIADLDAAVNHGKIQLEPVQWIEPQDSVEVNIPIKKEVSDAEAKKASLPN